MPALNSTDQDLRDQIAADLREKIRTGTYGPESKLPTWEQGAAQYGVARETYGAALSVLVSEGRAAKRSTTGTFVASGQPADVLPNLTAVSAEISELAKRVEGYDDLRAEVDDLRQRLGKMETVVMDLCDSLNVDYPGEVEHDKTAKQPARRKRAAR